MNNEQPRFTALGRLVSLVLVAGLIGLGIYMVRDRIGLGDKEEAGPASGVLVPAPPRMSMNAPSATRPMTSRNEIALPRIVKRGVSLIL